VIALDTDVVVRLLVQDDERQANRVERLLARCHEEGIRCLLTTVVLCELEWVLEGSYGIPRAEITAAVQGFLGDDLFAVEAPAQVSRALEQYQAGKGDLSDYLLGQRAKALQAATTYTFDRSLRDCEDFTLLR